MQVHREEPRFLAAGASLALVGNGGRHFARAFRDDLGITAPVYVDPERRAYRALGMSRGVGVAALSLATVGHGVRALRAGFRQGSVQGDPWQLGGVLVVRTGGVILYRHLSAAAGDHPPVAALVAAVEGGAGAHPRPLSRQRRSGP